MSKKSAANVGLFRLLKTVNQGQVNSAFYVNTVALDSLKNTALTSDQRSYFKITYLVSRLLNNSQANMEKARKLFRNILTSIRGISQVFMV